MRHTKTETKTVTRTIVTCDRCEQTTPKGYLCGGCGREICRRCRLLLYQDPWTGNDLGDYPEIVCPDCNKAVEAFAIVAREIQEQADAQIEALQLKWKATCKERKDD